MVDPNIRGGLDTNGITSSCEDFLDGQVTNDDILDTNDSEADTRKDYNLIC